MTSSTDGRGCLTKEELGLLSSLDPGSIPQDLSLHLAGCASCQQRALEMEAGPRPSGRKRARPVAPSPVRAILIGLAMVVAVVALLWSLRKLIEG